MIGQLVFGSGGPRQGEREKLYGLPVLRVRADMDSFWWERRVKKAGRALFRGGARRVLVPRGFPCWPLLSEYGLAPVDPGPFLRAQSPALALALLERRGAAPDRSTVVLCGARADWEMTRVAVTLCSQVRNLVIDAPKGGEELARWLRGEFGVPILPRREGGQAASLLSSRRGQGRGAYAGALRTCTGSGGPVPVSSTSGGGRSGGFGPARRPV